jgi:hypothetical protein
MSETTQERYATPILKSFLCLSVNLPEMTVNAIQQELEKLYLNWRANPQYLFCSGQDSEKIANEVALNTHIGRTIVNAEIVTEASYTKVPPFIPSPIRLSKLVNRTTGRLMSVVVLPEYEDGTLMFGFIEY